MMISNNYVFFITQCMRIAYLNFRRMKIIIVMLDNLIHKLF